METYQVLPKSTPEQQGLLSEDILAFLDALEAAGFNMHSFMLLCHSQVIAEGWWFPYQPGSKRYAYSLSKSFTSTAVGFAVTEGLLKVEDRVLPFFPDDRPAEISENLAAMRVKHLLTMTSGHATDTILALLTPGIENWAQAILSLPVDYPPGTHFVYNSGASYLLSAILQKVTGQTVLDYLTPRLFVPLGFSQVTWDVCPRGVNTGGWGMSLTTEEIARFGLFYAQKGLWNGTRLLPAAWIEEATAKCVRNDGEDRSNEPLDWRQGYGYQFWRCQHGVYRGDGAAGQYCIVMPAQDAVLAITSETDNMQGILDLVWSHLLPAMKDRPLPGKAASQEQLSKKLASLKLALPPARPHTKIAERISGKRFEIHQNAAGVRSLTFSFSPDSCRFQLWDGQDEHQIVCGNGAWIENESMMPFMLPSMMYLMVDPKMRAPVKVAAVGAWTDPQTYVMTWQYLETAHNDTVTCRFQGDELQMEVTNSHFEHGNPFLMGKENRYTGTLERVG